ncbi:hypothetical protein D5R40_32540 [Okeania hirsuta]|uniref:Uncharacterized protein n=1 Tax=Okeania hirsuta TaxID=1458930 RepID=A0A3N6PTP4_9CYAN|nr:hypothetical protein D5R40_32540 [Okeania hirsuta]
MQVTINKFSPFFGPFLKGEKGENAWILFRVRAKTGLFSPGWGIIATWGNYIIKMGFSPKVFPIQG